VFVLVGLMILLVTARYVAGLERARAGAAHSRVFEVSIDATGDVFVAGERVDEAGLRARVQAARRRDAALVASIAADEQAARGRVLHILGVLRQEWGRDDQRAAQRSGFLARTNRPSQAPAAAEVSSASNTS